ncbi:unnamed protein product [Nesidiocoris tenuis]|uniref:Amine oxidase domain-containing protein n=1 Tax=Nesidiocoris tenuis TaxID=355587 RepID=A0A6H5GRJ7_9HEMI|nr:unnamed protein product [Nesidiocoris tenuis]
MLKDSGENGMNNARHREDFTQYDTARRHGNACFMYSHYNDLWLGVLSEGNRFLASGHHQHHQGNGYFSLTCNKQKEDDNRFPRCEKITKTSCTFDRLDPAIKAPRVVIVGAGIAGLSAAHRLHQCGIRDVVILEAANRLGGRAYTCTFEGHSVDLGAQWIKGATIANPVFNLASQEKLLLIPTDLVKPFRGTFIHSDGTPVPDEIRDKSARIYRTILCHVKELYGDPDETAIHLDNSIWTFIMKHIELETSGMGAAEAEEVKNVLSAMMNCLKSSLGADLRDVPVDLHACSRPCLGGDTYLRDGFQSVVEAMANVVPKESIKLSQEVCSIKWANTSHEEGRVVVKTIDGNAYNGDYVIVTVSLGVMKDRHEKLFCPMLPDRKVEAIERIAFGNINRVYLLYDKPFWIKGEGTLRICWSADELADADKWVRSIGLIEEAPGHPKALMFSIGGPSAICVEQLSERCIARDVTNLLHLALNEPSLPTPNKIMRSSYVLQTSCILFDTINAVQLCLQAAAA